MLCGRFVDAAGQPVAGPLDERMIGIELDRLTGLAMGILVCVGADRVRAMLAVVRGGYATHLVTDTATAERMLAA